MFHKNPLNRLPVIGSITSKRNNKKYAAGLKEVDDGLAQILDFAIEHKQGAFYQLYEKLKPKYPDAYQIALDNSFLGILVYDFIDIILLDATAKIAKFPEMDRKKQVQRSMHDGFLYPFRFRTADEDFGDVKRGDYCVINLQKSGLYFSYGPRFCPGANLFKEIYTKFLEIYSEHDIRLVNPDEEIKTTGNEDLPFMTSSHDVKVCPFSKLFGGKKGNDCK